MNVALFSSSYHPHVGGVEEVVRQLTRQQRLSRSSPLILTNRWPKSLPACEEIEGAVVRRYVLRVPERTPRQLAGALLFGASTLREICADVRKHNCDILHVHCVSSNAYYAILAKRRLGLPLVVTLHGELTMDESGLFQRSAFARQLMRRVLDEADAITACSARTLADADTFYGKPLGDRARVIYNGVNRHDYARGGVHRPKRPYILAMGRLVPQKGFDVLIEAYARSRILTHDLVIAGDGREREALGVLAVRLGVSRNVCFAGQLDRYRAMEFVNGCSLVSVPSRASEGLPMVTLEALAAGKPVVASRVGGIPESVFDGETGVLVEREDTDALARALTDLVEDREYRDWLGANSLERSSSFAWSSIARQYEGVYNYAIRCGGKKATNGRAVRSLIAITRDEATT